MQRFFFDVCLFFSSDVIVTPPCIFIIKIFHLYFYFRNQTSHVKLKTTAGEIQALPQIEYFGFCCKLLVIKTCIWMSWRCLLTWRNTYCTLLTFIQCLILGCKRIISVDPVTHTYLHSVASLGHQKSSMICNLLRTLIVICTESPISLRSYCWCLNIFVSETSLRFGPGRWQPSTFLATMIILKYQKNTIPNVQYFASKTAFIFVRRPGSKKHTPKLRPQQLDPNTWHWQIHSACKKGCGQKLGITGLKQGVGRYVLWAWKNEQRHKQGAAFLVIS